MKGLRCLTLGCLLLLAFPALSQSSPALQVSLTWNAPSCASAVAANSSGQETAGPCSSQVYRATVASPAAACPVFSTSAYSLIAPAAAESSTSAAYADSTVATGSTYCYAVTDTFALGGAPSGVSNLFQITAIVGGSPGQPNGLSGTVVAPGD